jgi:putative ABC transport system ATP-binding protein
MLRVEQLTQTFFSGGEPLTVLDRVSFQIQAGESCAIVGPSGSGKTTLLGLCAGLDRATSGTVTLDGVRLDELESDALARLRNAKIGFVFQNFQLIPTLTAWENVRVPLELAEKDRPREGAKEWLERVGLGDRMHHFPSQLSGGEQQRVALARAFVNEPTILFADEPTGNLDEKTGEVIAGLLFDLNHQAGTTLVLVTHDMRLAERTKRVLRFERGRLLDS